MMIGRKLPVSVRSAIQSLSWNIDNSAAMHYKNLEEMKRIRTSSLFDIETVLSELYERASEQNEETRYLCRIAVSLILLGHGYADEAHNLILGLSWRGDLPYSYGPSVNVTDESVLCLACYAHCLIHRLEGPHDSEFGMTGFKNADFWAGNTMRNLDGVDCLPLDVIEREIVSLAGGSFDAQKFVSNAMRGILRWDPRILTELCSEVERIQREGGAPHKLKEFAERAATLELSLILQHTLSRIGYDW